MKAKKLSKKLVLKKITVTNLNHNEMDALKGGAVTYTCGRTMCPPPP